jgi:hypothetical protein
MHNRQKSIARVEAVVVIVGKCFLSSEASLQLVFVNVPLFG